MLTVFKPFGMTPKELVDEYVKIRGAKKGAFSGRLDPMACGVMKIYFDDDCKLANVDDKLNKTYRFVMIFGIGSTSCDLLGFPSISTDEGKAVTKEMIESCINTGEMIQTQPVHSSFIVKNKDGVRNPLWWWALHNRLDEVDVPSFKRTLYSLEVKSISQKTMNNISATAIERINMIDKEHTFRQDEIIDAWRKTSEINKEFYTAELVASVSSGFYIRQLVSDIGDALHMKTTTFEIERLCYN
jgi:tRNA U55 pseudouridine synthase TruB